MTQNSLSLDIATKIIKNLILCIDSIHSIESVHGQLTPYNIFIESNQQVLIGDLGFKCLKKACCFKNHYQYCTVYSAPEQLVKNALKQEEQKPVDIYAFAMIAYFIYT